MKSIILGIVIAVGIGIAASFILAENQRTAYDTYATSSVRVGVPGDNLVGPEWAVEDANSESAAGAEG